MIFIRKPITYLIILLLHLVTYKSLSQTVDAIKLEKAYLTSLKRQTLDIRDTRFLYVNDGQSDTLFYYAFKPPTKIKGTLILFPPTAQTAEEVINNNISLFELAHQNGILLIVPSINYNLYIDQITLDFLNTVFKDVVKKFKIDSEKIVMGGFSLGGMNAIRYTQLAYENESNVVFKPKAVYAIDPPLDWDRMYYSFQHIVEINMSKVAVQEASVYLHKLNRQFGGSPETHPKEYIAHSMFSKSKKDGGNARFLIDVPIRIYSDPDTTWHMTERGIDYQHMNAYDQMAMIKLLRMKGNEEAEYINALGKGYRPDGTRHPHSWSIADPQACIDWVLKNLK